MADESSSTGIVAIFAILFIVALAAFFMWRGGVFGGGKDTHKLEVDLKTSAYVLPAEAA